MKAIKFILTLSLFVFLLSCDKQSPQQNTVENNKNNSVSNQKELAEKNEKLTYDRLTKEAQKQISDTEFITREEIIKADVTATNPRTKEKVRDFKVNITQIDNSKFPEVSLIVSVTDKDGHPLNVDPDFFVIEEHGLKIPKNQIISVRQKMASSGFNKNDFPLNVILAIDKSGSMAGVGKYKENDPKKQPLWYAMKASVSFIKQANPDDLIQALAFDGDLHPLGSNLEAIDKIRELKPKGSTALYGALLASTQMLQIGKGLKAVILLSDGKNDTKGTINKSLKRVTLQQGILEADRLSIPVFTIGFGKGFDEYTLKKIAKETHALYFNTAKKEEIASLYSQIRQIINTQYVITYKSKSLEEITDVGIGIGRMEDRRTFNVPEHVVRRQKELYKKIALVEKEKSRLDQFEKELNQKLVKVNNEGTRLDKKDEALADKNLELKEEKKRLEKKESELNQFDKVVKNLESKNKKEQKNLKNLRSDLEGKSQELRDKEKKLNELQAALNNRERSLDTKDDHLSKQEKRLKKEMKQREEKLRKELEDLQKEKAKLNQQLITVENKEEKLNRAISENKSLKKKLEDERQKLVDERKRLAKVKDKLNKTLKRISEKHKQALKEVMEEKGGLESIKP